MDGFWAPKSFIVPLCCLKNKKTMPFHHTFSTSNHMKSPRSPIPPPNGPTAQCPEPADAASHEAIAFGGISTIQKKKYD